MSTLEVAASPVSVVRRRFLAASLVVPLLSSRFSFSAEHSTPRIGVLLPSLPNSPLEAGLREGLREAGYIEGKTIAIEWRRYSGAEEDIGVAASDLVHSDVDVIVSVGSPATQAALQATSRPVVFTAVGDPVATGFATSLAHPGGHGTGLSTLAPELMAKRLELLHQMVPRARRVIYLMNSANPVGPRMLQAAREAAQALRVELVSLDARDTDELDNALHAIQRSAAQGILVAGERVFLTNKAKVSEAIRTARLPGIVSAREYHDAGILMSYGPNLKEAMRRAAVYVDKILRGANPADLPIEQISTYELVIDLAAARALGLKVPQSLLMRADEVFR